MSSNDDLIARKLGFQSLNLREDGWVDGLLCLVETSMDFATVALRIVGKDSIQIVHPIRNGSGTTEDEIYSRLRWEITDITLKIVKGGERGRKGSVRKHCEGEETERDLPGHLPSCHQSR